MKLVETKGNVVTINLDLDVLKKYNAQKNSSKLDFGDYNEFLSSKAKLGNQDAILKTMSIIKKIMLKKGCSDYEQLKNRK